MNSQRREVQEFLRNISGMVGADWHIRHVWSPESGWAVEWRVGAKENPDHAVTMGPGLARQTFRDAAARIRGAIVRLTPEQREAGRFNDALAWLSAADRQAKDAIHLNRAGHQPAVTD